MRADLDTDLLVVGAGPAGSAAAITAARAGLDVVLTDKARFPRDKTCGDGLTTGALRRLEQLGFALDSLRGYMAVQETVLVAPSGRRVVLPTPADGEYAGIVPRSELDAALVVLARSHGARVREGAGIVGLTVEREHAVAALADGTSVRAPWLVAADGHFSPVRRLLAPRHTPYLGEWIAFRQYFAGVADPRLWVLFEADLLPGYAWVFPLPGGRANVGFGMRRGPGVGGKKIKARWRELLDRPGLRAVLGPRAVPEAPHRAWPVPNQFDPGALASGRVLFAGDAANVVDPMTGEGIAQALDTGVLAARCVAERGRRYERDDPDAVGAQYSRTVERVLGRDLRFAATLQAVLRSPRGVDAAIRAADLTVWTRRNFARWLYEDYPRALILTPRRWHRGMFTGPGSYRV